jgi:hypothetical protein
MIKYGTVLQIQDDKWTHNYRYNVGNGVRLVHMELKTHAPSHMYINGHRALVTYIGQPTTCYVCNKVNHIAIECPARKTKRTGERHTDIHTWANVVEMGHSVHITEGNSMEHRDIEHAATDQTHTHTRSVTPTRS